MQTEVPALPVVCSDGCKRSLTRKVDEESRITAASIKNQTSYKNAAILLSKRKQLHPLIGGPYYKNSARVYAITEPVKYSEKNPVGQRVLSAKMLRVKQLQNQLTDAHYRLNELANENRLLKALQKRQDSALRRYEGTNAELPRIINSHHEELRVLQAKYKKLKSQHKDTCDLLKEKENELHTLQTQNKHLMQLSKDRNLGEREKLQGQVLDLNHRIKRQNETIQMLHRKLALEGKSLKHQLSNEIAKNKAMQRHLNKTMEKLKGLEDLLDNREKKLYYNGQLPIFGKRKNITSQSLTNLSADGRNPTNFTKNGIGNKDHADPKVAEKSLPILHEKEPNVLDQRMSNTTTILTSNTAPLSPKTETMASLNQIRKFRLQKSPLTQKLSARDRLRERHNEMDIDDNETIPHAESSQKSNTSMEQYNINAYETKLSKFGESLENETEGTAYKLPRELRKEFGYSTSESESEELENSSPDHTQEKQFLESTDLTTASKELHARLTTEDHTSTSIDKNNDKLFTDVNSEKFVNEKLKFKRESALWEPVKKTFNKAECKAEMSQLKAAAGISESDSESDSAAESSRQKEKYDFVLKNAPEDSENEDSNHPIENVLTFDGDHKSDSGAEFDGLQKMKKRASSNKPSGRSKISESPIASRDMNDDLPKSPDDNYDGGRQRLMDITKSWTELQEKIMREREISENQIKGLESELEDDLILEKKNVHRIDNDEIKRMMQSTRKVSLTLNSQDNFTENIDQKLYEVDNKQSKKSRQLARRNSISLDNMNLGIESSENLRRLEHRLSIGKFEHAEIQSSELELQEKEDESFDTVADKETFPSRSGAGDNFISSIKNELSQVDATQAALQSMVLETKRQINENQKSKTKQTNTTKIDNSKKTLNHHTQQETDVVKKVTKTLQQEPSYKEEMSSEARMINYNKEKLLAAMKAIDNNENVEFLDLQKSQKGNGSSRSQITENLYRGVPTHNKKKDDLIKELFGDGKGDTKTRNGCTKMH
ncbi:putative protein tag-278 isoform X1 [Athalia rosae]|uniref:putative protein tag-278 isoform X1 n=2 Tax=Athalia rosae TaxID=37344 RepID=UPI002033A6A2|nr:putative protein tag-278 isoform X1 [Athalia rosae]